MADNKMKCPECGKFVFKGKPYCTFCGEKLGEIIDNEDEDEDEDLAPIPPSSSLESPIQSSYKESSYTTESKKIAIEEERTLNNIPENPTQNDLDDIEEEVIMPDEKTPPSSNYEDDSSEDDEADEGEADEGLKAFKNAISGGNGKVQSISSEKIPQNNTLKKGAGVSQKINSSKIKDNIRENFRVAAAQAFQSKPQNPSPTNQSNQSEEFEEKSEQLSPYDPNHDGYYDNVIALIDARTEHITKESIFKTLGLVALTIVCIVFFIYFV